MLWIKSFHIIFMVSWFAALLYLPRLYVYHALAVDRASIERFKIMERKLFWGIMTPAGLLTLGFGAWLWSGYGYAPNWVTMTWTPIHWLSVNWLTMKLFLVGLVVGFHVWCYFRLVDFSRDENRYGHVYYRWMNEVPIVLLIAIIILTVVKPL